MKTFACMLIGVVAGSAVLLAAAIEPANPVEVSMVCRTNDPAGKSVVRFVVSNTNNTAYHFYFQAQVWKDDDWSYSPIQPQAASQMERLEPGESRFMDVFPPRTAKQWRIRMGYMPDGTSRDEGAIHTKKLVEK